MTSLLKFLLEEGIVDAILAVKKGSDLYDAVPTLITDPDKVIETAGSLHCGTLNIAKVITRYLKNARDMKDRLDLQQRHHWYVVPPGKRRYPNRHQQASQLLTDEDLIADGVKTGQGGHYGADNIMFESVVSRRIEKQPAELDIFAAAEQMAPLILGVEAIKKKKAIDVPKFD